MHKQVVFPEFLGESELAVVVVIPSLKEDMSHLFKRFHAGEEIDYWFSWDLVVTDSAEYLVLLEMNWDQEESLVVAFNREMWEFLNVMAEKQSMVLMADWQIVDEGAPDLLREEEFRPYALLIRNVHTGLDKLYNHVKELVGVNEGIEELIQLQLILEGTQFPKPTTLH